MTQASRHDWGAQYISEYTLKHPDMTLGRGLGLKSMSTAEGLQASRVSMQAAEKQASIIAVPGSSGRPDTLCCHRNEAAACFRDTANSVQASLEVPGDAGPRSVAKTGAADVSSRCGRGVYQCR